MRLLDFVEQHHGIRSPPYGFRELAAFVVADISRRRADQPGHRVLLLVLRHIDANHRVLVVEQELRERARKFGFADARRTQEDEAADRPLRDLSIPSGRA